MHPSYHRRLVGAMTLVVLAAPVLARAQDTTRVSPPPADSILRHSARLNQVTITATPVERSEPLTVTHIDAVTIGLTPFRSPWELFRQAAGLETHQQGQGPGFASDLSVRGFSSDHSTDIAMYIDGVPNNEPVNGHAEGYNDLNLLFPQIVTGMDVVKGPTSALYGNFAFGGAVNVRTLEPVQRARCIECAAARSERRTARSITGFDHGSTRRRVRRAGVARRRLAHALRKPVRPRARGDRARHHVEHDDRRERRMPISRRTTRRDSSTPRSTTPGKTISSRTSATADSSGTRRSASASAHSSSRISSGGPPSTRSRARGISGSVPRPDSAGSPKGTGAETHEYDGRYGFGGTTALTFASEGVDITLGADARYTHAHYENYAESSIGFRVDSVPLVLADAGDADLRRTVLADRVRCHAVCATGSRRALRPALGVGARSR